MVRALLLLLGLLLLAGLAWFCIDQHAETIERDLTERATRALAAGELTALTADVDGRDVTLSGSVADNSERARALDLTERVYGVRTVRDRLSLAAAAVPAPAPVDAAPAATAPAPEPAPPALPAPVPEVERVARARAAAVSCQTRFNDALAGEAVQFETGAARVKVASHGLLDRLAEIAGTCPDARLEIRGHTDSQGAAEFNRSLSEDRAAAVRAYLLAQGLSTGRIDARGFGEEAPVADNATAAGRALNRRVEVIVEGL
jgi:outer membrane protein OmpA-like peptidoglycan-associated protein